MLSRRCDSSDAGHHIAQLPVDARVGKLLLIGTALGCLAPVLTIAACLSYKSPFQSSYDQQDAMEKARAGLAAAGTCPPPPLLSSGTHYSLTQPPS